VTPTNETLDIAEYLRPTDFIDSECPDIVQYAHAVTGRATTDVEKAVALYYAVRDGIRYDPYTVDLSINGMRASSTLRRGSAFCVPKAVLLAAAARAIRIPSRLGFADVKNHLASDRLLRLMQTDLFVFHGYAELFLEGDWVKATPAFDSSLCERFNVAPLEFDGYNDSVFQQYDREGSRFMHYVCDRGRFSDLPLEEMRAAFQQHYPALMAGAAYNLPGSLEHDISTD
jgi:transglutaminase-like putative cysteine protease